MAFVRNAWYCAGWSADLDTSGLIGRTFLNEPVLLYRLANGKAVAIGNRCPHRFAPLHCGKKIGDAVQCAYHGLRFDATGECVHNPHGDGTIPGAARVKSYPLAERYGALWIWMGTPDEADAAQIPDFSEIAEREGWAVIHGYLEVRAHYELVADNLLDLSHVNYLHPFLSFTGEPPPGYREERALNQVGESVWSRHSWLNSPITPLFRLLWDDAPDIVNGYADMRWDAPSNLLMPSGVAPVDGQREDGVALPMAHLLTPATDMTTHYFWCQARNRKVDDAALAAQLREGIDSAFRLEDEVMVVACQEMMGTTDLMSLKPVLLPGDGPAIRARRILGQRLERELGTEAPLRG